LEVYGLDSALVGARASVAAAEARLADVRRERDEVERRLRVARRTVAISQRHLGERLRELYENGSTDPVAVLLGAKSLDQAISTLEGLHRFASQDRSVIRQARAARAQLRGLSRNLAARETELEQERARAAAEVATLQRASDARRVYLAELRRDRALTARRIRDVVATAQAASARNDRLTPPTPVASAPAPVPAPSPVAGGGRTLTVVATGYALQGTTATGLPTSWGVVAVDPSVIPLGTRMTIPGYGAGVAADVGSAIQGAIIDLWFPSEAEALAWGRRTVTITLH
jgi:3D (Asp-Asp-Asp) domain-containing protein